MRNLKRVLSLALASVMVVSMMVIGAGAANFDDFSDKDEIVNKEAVSVLVELGVLAGKDDGSYDPTGIITRGEMAKIICVVLNKGQDPNLGAVNSNTYTDTVGHWAAPYIEYCTTLGIVAGKGDGTFAPNDTVTASEASKMLLVALGYNAQYENMIGANWAVATNVLANKNGLYDGLTLDVSAGLTRDNAAQMMYNALDAKVVAYDYSVIPDGDSISAIATAKETGKTLLEDKFGAVKVTGVVVRNEYGSVDGSAAMDEGQSYVRVTNYGTNEEQQALSSGKYYVTTSLDQLGKTVDMYVKPGNSSVTTNATVVGSALTSSVNKVVTYTSYSSSKTIAERAKDDGLKFGTTTENNVTTDNATFVVNYSNTVASFKNSNGANGVAFVIIDNDDDGYVDYALQNFEVFGRVSAYNTKDDGSITIVAYDPATGYGFYDSDNDDYSDRSVKKDDSAKVVGFEDVAKDDYVFVQEIGDKLYVRKAESVEMTPTSTKGHDFIADGTTYKQADTVDDVDEIDATTDLAEAVEIGTAAAIYLDAYGYVVRVADVESTVKYLYVIEVGNDNLQDRAKVAFADGSTATITISSVNSTVGNDNDAVAQDTIYSYTTNSKGEYRLNAATGENPRFRATTMTETDGAVDSNGNFIAKGNAKLNTAAGTLYANSETVFVVENASGTWSVYTGIANVPNLKKDQHNNFTASVAYNTTDSFADVVFVTESDLSTSSDLTKVVYFLEKNPSVTKNSDDEFVYTYSVVYKGEKTTLEADAKFNLADTGLYMPTFDGSDIMTTQGSRTVPSKVDKAEAGVIALEDDMIVGGVNYGKTFTVNSDTVILAIDGTDVSTVDLKYITTGADGDNVVVVPVKDNESVAAYIFIQE